MPRQLPLGLKFWGGSRKGAGRKRKGLRAMVSHEPRTRLSGRDPVHVTMRVLPEIPSLRAMHSRVRRALFAGAGKRQGNEKKKIDFRLIHFSIQSNHLHLIAEADSKASLSRGMKGLAVRVAWAVNRALGRKRGKVFSDRYHSRVLGTPREANLALHYVLSNYRKHQAEAGRTLRPRFRDPCSSWTSLNAHPVDNPLAHPSTWVLCGGYRLGGGEIDLSKTPGLMPKPKPKPSSRASRS